MISVVELIIPIAACIIEAEMKKEKAALTWADDLNEVATSALWLYQKVHSMEPMTNGLLTQVKYRQCLAILSM